MRHSDLADLAAVLGDASNTRFAIRPWPGEEPQRMPPRQEARLYEPRPFTDADRARILAAQQRRDRRALRPQGVTRRT